MISIRRARMSFAFSLTAVAACLLLVGCPPAGRSPEPAEMVSVSSGWFDMGDSFGEGYDAERPVHRVTLSAYEIGIYEVTNQEYVDVLNWAQDRGLITYSLGYVSAFGDKTLLMTGSNSISRSGNQFPGSYTRFRQEGRRNNAPQPADLG